MKASDSIARKNANADDLDFNGLRKDAITLTQALSGNIWTDYNLHDPGVTILEQLCFGLSELAYEAGESVENFLGDEHGHINYKRFGLRKPHEILPSSAVTPGDYCKLIVDAIPDIDAIRVVPASDEKAPTGLYHIIIKLLEPVVGPGLDEHQKQKIVESIKRVYFKNRNLSEDIADIVIEKAEPCYLSGDIETTGKRNIAEIYADVFFQCSRKIFSNITIDRYEDMFATTKDLSQLFLGPLTEHGYIKSDDLTADQQGKYLEELTNIVARIEGVKKVYGLSLVDGNSLPITMDDSERSFFLRFPQEKKYQALLNINFNPSNTTEATGIARQDEVTMELLLEEAKRSLQKLEFQYRAFRNNKSNVTTFYDLPAGTAHENLPYYSIQHHFPDVYGVNATGISRSELPVRKTQAKQLKAYLYPFEQILANTQQQLQHVSQLFALDDPQQQSYFSVFLDDDIIPLIEELYQSKRSAPHQVESILHQYDNVVDRKSRVLDTLLALYGENFSQEALMHFNYCNDDDTWMLTNKVNFLNNISELSCYRGGASYIDPTKPQDQQIQLGGMHKKIAILLGIKYFDQFLFLSDVLEKQNINLVKNNVFEKAVTTLASNKTKSQLVPELSQEQTVKLKRGKVNIKGKMNISTDTLQSGVNLNAYRLVKNDAGTNVYIESKNRQKLVLLKTLANDAAAISYAHMYRKIICDLNQEIEGFHLIEHILLRPRMPESSLSVSDKSFLNFRVSFIFPAWGARFSDPAFRQFAEKTICNQLPAHLFSSVYWLTPEDMKAFENVYKEWLERLNIYEQQYIINDETQEQVKLLDKAARYLVNWLRERPKSNTYWV